MNKKPAAPTGRKKEVQRLFLPGQSAMVGTQRWRVGAVLLTDGEPYLLLINKHGVTYLCPEREAT